MTGQEILDKYPLSTVVIKDYFFRRLEASCEEADVPQEFKDYLLASGIENEQIKTIIDENPRLLFDVFDENELFINILKIEDGFKWEFSNYSNKLFKNDKYKTRKDAESQAVFQAFSLLENKLNSL